jgi:hypothetical protein
MQTILLRAGRARASNRVMAVNSGLANVDSGDVVLWGSGAMGCGSGHFAAAANIARAR